MRSDEHILVAGSGIAGLGAALALGGGTRRVTILDRDPPPPTGSAEEAFYNWERRGATQLRHSHAFLGRLTSLIRDRYPELMAELLAEGTRLFGFEDGLTPPQMSQYAPAQGDEDLKLLFSRAPDSSCGASGRWDRFVTDAACAGCSRPADRRGPQIERGGASRRYAPKSWSTPQAARRSPVAAPRAPWCAKAPLRHPLLHAPLQAPDGRRAVARQGASSADLGYIKFGVFIADNRTLHPWRCRRSKSLRSRGQPRISTPPAGHAGRRALSIRPSPSPC